jgi:hypothetical protein
MDSFYVEVELGTPLSAMVRISLWIENLTHGTPRLEPENHGARSALLRDEVGLLKEGQVVKLRLASIS